MSKEYTISPSRRVLVKKHQGEHFVTIEEPGSDLKTVTLPAKRWAALVACEPQVDESVLFLKTNQYVKYVSHIGGSYFVSVTTGFACVDIREFYYNLNKGPLPSRHGIALNLTDWSKFKEIVQEIKQQFPKLAKTELCNHHDLDNLLSCTNCQPYGIYYDPSKAPPA
jgi:hypothetical protein